MNADRKSDEPVVPATSANKDATEASAESIEGRGSTERNAKQDALCRTQHRTKHRWRGLHGVREAARNGRHLEANIADPPGSYSPGSLPSQALSQQDFLGFSYGFRRVRQAGELTNDFTLDLR